MSGYYATLHKTVYTDLFSHFLKKKRELTLLTSACLDKGFFSEHKDFF